METVKQILYFDIAANLSAQQYTGVYRGKRHHDADLDQVFKRADEVGCDRLLVTSSYLKDAHDCLQIAKSSDKYYCTVGVHPTRTSDIEKNGGLDHYKAELCKVIESSNGKCVAIGECGLDYDRFQFSDKETQLKYFPFHFELAEKYKLPLYLHDRNTGGDFYKIIKENRHRFSDGIVHSFTGNLDELKQYLDLDLYIGVNGCSLKKKRNIEVVKHIPLNRIMLETDCPYCEIKKFHDSYKLVQTKFPVAPVDKYDKDKLVEDRNEPCTIVQVAEAVASILKIDIAELADTAYRNTLKSFGIKDERFENKAETK